MSVDVSPLVGPEELTSIVEDVWSSLVGPEEFLVPLQEPMPLDALSAWVYLTGPWSGALVLTCAQSTAAALVLALVRPRGDEALDEEDVEDALGELANVVGGGVKSLLPAPASLGLPQVGPCLGAPTGSSVVTLHLSWRGQAVTVALRCATASTSDLAATGTPFPQTTLFPQEPS